MGNNHIFLSSPGDSHPFHDSFGKKKHVHLGWKSCPVSDCKAFVLGHRAKFKRHWIARHERYVTKYFCPVCRAAYKRKDDLRAHTNRHEDFVLDMDKVECQFLENKEFLDPHPFTLETAIDYQPD